MLLLHDAHVEVDEDANDWCEELLKGGRVQVHLLGEEDDLLVDFADEDGVHHEHDEVHEATRVHVIDVEEEFGAPGGKQLAHSEQIDGGLEVALSFSESQHLEVALQLLEYDEQFGGDVVYRVEECVHEVLRHLVVQVEQLHSQLVQEVRTRRLFDVLLVDDLLEALAFRESQNVFGNVSQVDVFDE